MIEIADHTSGLPALPVDPPRTINVFDKKVMVAFPWYKSAHPITAFCTAHLLDKRRTSSVLNYGDAMISHSRNSITDAFLKTDLEFLLSVDDDMCLPIGNAKWFKTYTGWDWMPDQFAGLNTLDRLMSHKKSVVGALYFGRFAHGPPVFCEGGNEDIAKLARSAPVDRILSTNWVGTGAILFNRKVFEDIEKNFPLLSRANNGGHGQWFSPSEYRIMDDMEKMRKMLSIGPMDGQKALKCYEMLEASISKAKQMSNLSAGEDVSFCRRARDSGHEIFVDLGLVCGHSGNCIFGPRNTSFRK